MPTKCDLFSEVPVLAISRVVDTVSMGLTFHVSKPTNRLDLTVWVLLLGLRSWCGVVFPEGNVLLGYNLVTGVDR